MDCREGVCGTCQGCCETGDYYQEYVDEEVLSAEDLATGKMLSCQTKLKSDATFHFDFASSICTQTAIQTQEATVVAIEFISDSAVLLHVTILNSPNTFEFLPGQYAKLAIPGTQETRAYSFANKPNKDNKLQFIMRLLPDGVMSNYLRDRCQVGDKLTLEGPLGIFYLRQVTKPLIFVAGGTGLSAFLGMLDNLVEQQCTQPITLYYGVRKVKDLCELERIKGYEKLLVHFTFMPMISETDDNWTGAKGVITDYLDIAKLPTTPTDIYVCGPPPMVEAVKDWLVIQKLLDYKIYYEKFVESQ